MPIARVALPVATDSTFDYWVPEGLAVVRGSMVRVRLGTRRLVGVVTDIANDSEVAREKVQPIADVVAGPPLPADVLDLAAFVAAYYQEPTGLALALAVPPLAEAVHLDGQGERHPGENQARPQGSG